MKKILNEFMEQILDDAAWRELSENFQWTEPLLDKCKNRVDWKLVCDNQEIQWTPSMLNKFIPYIHWVELSNTCCKNILTSDLLEKYKDLWDWSILSRNASLTLSFELIDRFLDYWDWSALIDRFYAQKIYTKAFLERYAEYIPLHQLMDSRLWSSMVQQHAEEILLEINA